MSTEPRVERVAYGADPQQWGELWLPGPGLGPWPVTILLHGGFWRAPYTLELMWPLAADLAGRGQAVWNLEYRRVGCSGGGWPGTLADVAAGIDALVSLAGPWMLELGRVVLVGHSAGGQMALWAAGRHSLGPDEVGAGPLVRPVHVVSLAGVSDLVEASRRAIGEDATADFMGGSPESLPGPYEHASPLARVPTGVPTLLVHGDADVRVPIGMSERYAAAATAAGDQVETLLYEGVDHLGVIDPAAAPWRDVAARIWP